MSYTYDFCIRFHNAKCIERVYNKSDEETPHLVCIVFHDYFDFSQSYKTLEKAFYACMEILIEIDRIAFIKVIKELQNDDEFSMMLELLYFSNTSGFTTTSIKEC
ncbi:MAG: hypothetical protein EOO46_23055 [Flavobacterium sp.]|nr:MAG: hypothetical protein EOO46_23055 [Flavobacterium sp.]